MSIDLFESDSEVQIQIHIYPPVFTDMDIHKHKDPYTRAHTRVVDALNTHTDSGHS